MTTIEEAKMDAKVELYIKLRDYIKSANAEFKKSLEKKFMAMQQIEGEVQEFLDKTGQTSGRCKTGTFYTTTKYSATIKDKAEFVRHVVGTENWDLLDWKCNATAARDFEKETKAPLPGVAITAIAKVGIRRPGATAEED